jgi:putative flippase GtrA
MKTDVIKFAVVGVANTAIDFLLLNLFVHLGLTIFWAIFFAYLLGAVNGYLLNNRWTYRHLNHPNTVSGYLKYAAVSFVGLFLTEAIIYILSHILHVDNFNINKLVAVAVVFGWNFLSNRIFTFRAPVKA